MDYKVAFKIRVKEARAVKGYTQRQLASVLGLSSKAVEGWEYGSRLPSLGVLVQLADALDVSTDWLLGRD